MAINMSSDIEPASSRRPRGKGTDNEGAGAALVAAGPSSGKWKGKSCAGLLVELEVTDEVATTHSEGSVEIRPRCGLLLREDALSARRIR